MVIWFIFAGLTALVLIPVLKPLWRASASAATASAATAGVDPMGGAAPTASTPAIATDVALYKAQLNEIEEARARGLLTAADAEAARHEVARRLLARESDAPQSSARPVAVSNHTLGLATAALVPALAIAAYALNGSPNLPSQPFAERQRLADAKLKVDKAAGVSADELVRRVEDRLARNPEDGQGWDVIAPVYFQMQRFDDAARAYGNALRLQGETTRRLAGLGESLVYAANGIVTEPARQAFQKILTREPGRPEPKFWIALAIEQDGKIKDAITAYRTLLDGAPADARWRPVVEDRLQRIDPTFKPAARLPATPPVAQGSPGALPPMQSRGPSADDMKAAQSLPPHEQRAMIAGMVDGLAQRLTQQPKDLNGWMMLTQSFMVLGRKADAQKSLASARSAFSDDATALARLDGLAKTLGLDT